MTELKETENAADMAAEAESTGAAGRVVPPEEAADYEEFRRRKRAIELRSKLRGLEPTLLRQDASLAEVRALCERAKRFSAACVCVQPVYAAVCRDFLKDSGVGVSCVVGGNSESLLKTKLCEETACLRAGAAEVEFYPSVSAVVNGNFAYFRREVRKAVRRARGRTVSPSRKAQHLLVIILLYFGKKVNTLSGFFLQTHQLFVTPAALFKIFLRRHNLRARKS